MADPRMAATDLLPAPLYLKIVKRSMEIHFGKINMQHFLGSDFLEMQYQLVEMTSFRLMVINNKSLRG
jgi:hypothetical protein